MRIRPRLDGFRLGLTYGAGLVVLGLIIAALDPPISGARLSEFPASVSAHHFTDASRIDAGRDRSLRRFIIAPQATSVPTARCTKADTPTWGCR